MDAHKGAGGAGEEQEEQEQKLTWCCHSIHKYSTMAIPSVEHIAGEAEGGGAQRVPGSIPAGVLGKMVMCVLLKGAFRLDLWIISAWESNPLDYSVYLCGHAHTHAHTHTHTHM